jgi:hypothetical protein
MDRKKEKRMNKKQREKESKNETKIYRYRKQGIKK